MGKRLVAALPAPDDATAALLTLLAERAPALRSAGITLLKFADVELHMEHAEPAAVTEVRSYRVDKSDDDDPLNDPATFGRTDRAPGFARPTRDDDEAR